MTTTISDISIVLSGGSENLNPDHSIGGNPSNTPISNNLLNNLFSDITSDQNIDGVDDFRCIYFFNDGDTIIYQPKVFILEDFDNGATIQTGIYQQDEIQRILITGIPTGGSMTLTYDTETPFTIDYNSDLSVMALNIQNELNALVDDNLNQILQDVTLTAQPVGSNIIFDITFGGKDGSRSHPLIIVANNFTPTVTTTVSKIRTGGPINTIAPGIGQSSIPPGGVGFFQSSLQSPIELPKLRPGDGFPLWLERTVPENTAAKANDGFTIRFQAESLEI